MPEPTSSAARRAPSCWSSSSRTARSPRSASTSSARRMLREKFGLGLFENPFVDEDAADEIVGRADFRAAGEAAQRAAITLLTNRPVRSGWADDGTPALPLERGHQALRRGHRRRHRRAVRRDRRDAGRGGCRDPAPAGAVRRARHDVRELLPRRLARLPGRRPRARERDRGHRADDRRRLRRSPRDPRADRRSRPRPSP